MQRWRGDQSAPPGWGRCVVTIGVLDGVHRGHQVIIDRAVQRARDSELPSLVLTFDPHPSEVVRPGSHPAVLTTPRRKAELIEALGVDVLCVLPFTLEFSRLGPAEFVHQVLVEHLHAAAVVVGANFRFGHRAAGDLTLLRDLGQRFGFVTEGVAIVAGGDTVYSSTFIRSSIDAGDVAGAARALGRWHRLEGVVVRGDRRGRELGYPTANLEPAPGAAVPADGVYAGRLIQQGQARPAAISIGTNPTFEGRERRIEAYLLDFDGDLYGEHLALDFVERLRGMHRFDDVAALQAQMAEDVAQTRRALAAG
ncbi:MAG: bifunctional riboflavin kinase/FAD synthetase [Actinomycetota bacterium]|nr:bifunctional riboflavin kinase/FAD synthetase [Actinomycetota bacterium]